MAPRSWAERLLDWVRFVPVRIGFRLVWLAALTGDQDAEDVYIAMWAVGLDLPPIAKLVQRAEDAAPLWTEAAQ